jgi:hypothetical protein
MSRVSPEVAACLDEIEAAHDMLRNKQVDGGKVLRGWVRQQKALLANLSYKGKVPRKRRCT